MVATFQAAVVDGVSSDESSSDEKKKEGGKGEAEGGEGDEATMRVLKKWAKAKVVDEDDEDAEEAYDKKVEEAMEEWKKGYYKVRLVRVPSRLVSLRSTSTSFLLLRAFTSKDIEHCRLTVIPLSRYDGSQEKLEFKYPDGSKAEVEKLVYTYIEGLQWVMHYYYTGVASWGWFYNYHYAPRISGEFAFHHSRDASS